MYKLHLIPLEERIVLDAAAGAVIFVDKNAPVAGLNDGSSWVNAYKNLQAALTQAAGTVGVAEQIWVADGTYTPTALDPNPNRSDSATFLIPDLTTIYGGFLGGEGLLSQRDLSQPSLTILSGDIVGNDPLSSPSNRNDSVYLGLKLDNVNHVVTIDRATVTLDGLTIMNGFAANAPSTSAAVASHEGGAGVFIWSSMTSLSYVTLLNNDARASVNAQFRGSGGALAATANPTVGSPNPILSFDHVLVENNFTNRLAGGLYLNIGTVDMSNSILRNNSVVRPANAQAQGGGGQFTNSTVHITDSLIENNRVTSESGTQGAGGGIYAPQSSTTIENSTFRSNFSANRAGGIGIDNGNSRLVIKGSLIEGNIAQSAGAGIETFFATDHLILQDSIIRNNIAISLNPLGNGFGAGLFIRGAFTGVNSNLIERTLFENNVAVNGFGGAINLNSPLAIATISDSQFIGNSGAGGGGAIASLGQLTITGSLFENNTAANATNGRGGAILNSQLGITIPSMLALSDSQFYGNSSGLDGGAIYIASTLNMRPTAQITHVDIRDNTAVRNGGGLFTNNSITTVTDTTFHGNSALSGGAIYVFGAPVGTSKATSTLNIVNGHFNHNYASLDGGSIAAVSTNILGVIELSVTGSHFLNSNAGRDGGSIFLNNLDALDSLATISYNHFNHNEALANGGGIAAYNSNLLLLHNWLANNQAEVLGDDIYISAMGQSVNGELTTVGILGALLDENHFGNLDPNDIVVDG